MAEKEKQLLVKCPTCGKKSPWKENQYRPFCSQRCKIKDLGSWADGSYAIESSTHPDFEEEQT
jgi:uncharacterized protein